jgi:hypothetical protein
MRSRQVKIVEGTELSDKFQGDPVRLFVAAKLMACTAFVHMNVSPWNLNVGKRITRLSSTNSRIATDKKSLRFALSCIVTCLDCLCDLPSDSHVMGHLYSIIALVFTNMTGLVTSSGDSFPAHQDIGDASSSLFLPVLEKCFKVHIRSFGESQDSLSLRLLYCTIRGVNSFLASCAPERSSNANGAAQVGTQETGQNQASETVENSEDIWGSLGDDIFAAMDLVGQSASNEIQTDVAQMSLWSCFTNALARSKVSKIKVCACASLSRS